MSSQKSEVIFATRGEWIAFVAMLNAPLSRREPHRGEERSPFQLEVLIVMEDEGQTVRRRLALLNVSKNGMMVKGDTEMEIGKAVLVEVNKEGTPFHVVGVIRHCTQTLGGFKIGVHLNF
ncbi:MAG TPA: PilZ domain-containing protein [Phycisphaerae bacterium]|nr:PilZ domain-containing protein [Phycisphaerae bacterium]